MRFDKLIPIWLIGFYPLALILGTLISEIINLFLIIFFFYFSYKNKNPFKFKDPLIYFLILIWVYLLINLYFSIDRELSFSRSFFFIRYPLLVISICYFLHNSSENINIIFKLWMITLMVTIFDLYIQYFFGENLLGFKSPWDARLSGFFNEELKVAHLLISFFLPAIAFYFQKNPRKLYLYIFITAYFLILILTNERANIIRGTLILFTFLMLIPNYNIKLSCDTYNFSLNFSLSIISIDSVNQRFIKEFKNLNENIEIKKTFKLRYLLKLWTPLYN